MIPYINWFSLVVSLSCPIKLSIMIKFGFQLTVYILCSGALFLVTSNTMLAWVIYLFFLFPCYGLILFIYWFQVGRSKNWTYGITSSNIWFLRALLLPALFYCGPFCIVLLACWYFVRRTKKWSQNVRLRRWIWSPILILQLAAIVTSPADCSGWKQGTQCQSKLNVMIRENKIPSRVIVPQWLLVLDSFYLAYVASYAAMLMVASIPVRNITSEEDT